MISSFKLSREIKKMNIDNICQKSKTRKDSVKSSQVYYLHAVVDMLTFSSLVYKTKFWFPRFFFTLESWKCADTQPREKW